MAMQLPRLNPFTRTALEVPVNQLFREFFSFPWQFGEDLGLTTSGPALDVFELPEEYVVKADLPGFDRNNISLRFENRTLTLSGERKLDEMEGTRYHRVESFSGKFTRSFTLPIEINVEQIKAEMNDGVLTVHLPKAESARPRQIAVQVG